MIIFAPLLALFALGASHPFIDAPMNLTLDPNNGLLPVPTYYSGAYHQSEHYLSSKRVEVQIDFSQIDIQSVKNSLFAGIGVQSPNCCKDGLDYGYRADLLFNSSGIFLVARAWETCDINVACGGFPWISIMHQTVTPLQQDIESVMLAMEWKKDERTVAWYYKSGSDWREYSHFIPPNIENAYFNLGVIGVGNPITNPETGNAYFYQAGVSIPHPNPAPAGSLTFDCPAYYDAEAVRHCVEMDHSPWELTLEGPMEMGDPERRNHHNYDWLQDDSKIRLT